MCTFSFFLLLKLLPLIDSANILGVFFYPSISHQVVFQSLWKELSLRGHNVTVMTPNPLKDPSLVNLTEIDVSYTHKILEQRKVDQTLSNQISPITLYRNLKSLIHDVVEAQLQNTQFQQIIKNSTQNFDLILVQCYHAAPYALSAIFNAPIICISSLAGMLPEHIAVGNINHPVLYPNMFLNMRWCDSTLSERIYSVIFDIFLYGYNKYVTAPKAHEIAVKHLSKNIPYVGDLENNVTMIFVNVNPFIYPIRPNVPAVVEINQMHIRAPQVLPQDLKSILDRADNGAIYLSLGSNVKSINIPIDLKRNITAALSELPYVFLWKWEADYMPDKPVNVMIRKWFPQQDVLAHRNIKVFITQGGLQSIEEAIAREVPMIGIPFISDQSYNVKQIVGNGVAIQLDHTKITKEEFKNAIIEVAENKKYKKKIQEINRLLKDQPMTGLEKAVWWCEYVIRHKGINHLKSPLKDISFINYLLLDVVAVLLIALLIVAYVCYKLLKRLMYNQKVLKVKTL